MYLDKQAISVPLVVDVEGGQSHLFNMFFTNVCIPM